MRKGDDMAQIESYTIQSQIYADKFDGQNKEKGNKALNYLLVLLCLLCMLFIIFLLVCGYICYKRFVLSRKNVLSTLEVS